jgi:hypothetical protein
MGSGVSKKKAGEEAPKKLQKGMTKGLSFLDTPALVKSNIFEYRVQKPDGELLRIVIKRRKGKPCPSVKDIKYEISNATKVPPGCFALWRLIIDWEKELKDLNQVIEGDAPKRLTPSMKYALVDPKQHTKLGAKIKKKKFTLKQLDALPMDDIQQYLYFHCDEQPVTDLDTTLKQPDILNKCFEQNCMKVAHCVVAVNYLFGSAPLEYITPAGPACGQNMFCRACVRDPDLAVEMMDKRMVNRKALNHIDEWGAGPLHFAVRKGAWELASKIVLAPNVERWTLQGVHKITKEAPLDIAWAEAERTKSKKGYLKLKDFIQHKVEKIAMAQKAKKATMSSKGGKQSIQSDSQTQVTPTSDEDDEDDVSFNDSDAEENEGSAPTTAAGEDESDNDDAEEEEEED